MTIEEIEKLVESRYPDKTPYTKEFIRKSIERYGDVYSYEKTNRVDNNLTKVIITCPIHGDFEIDPYYFIKSKYCKGCPKCNPGKTSKKDKNCFLEALYSKFPEYIGLYDFSESTDYVDSYTPIKNIKCLKHNVYFSARPHNLMFGKISCRECKKEFGPKHKKETARKSAIDLIKSYGITDFIFPEVSEYDQICNAKVKIVCKVHGEYEIPYKRLSFYMRSGINPCVSCRKDQRRVDKAKYYYDKLVDLFSDYDFDFSWILQNYVNENEKILVRCNEHGTESWMLIHNLLKGQIPCHECRKLSHGEEYTMSWLDKNKIDYKFQSHNYSIEGRTLGSHVVLDFCIPSLNVWIECNGEQHYMYTKRFQNTLEDYNAQIKRDNNIRKYCKDNGISLIEIPWIFYKKELIYDILDQILLKNKSFSDLGLKTPEIKTYPNGLGD